MSVGINRTVRTSAAPSPAGGNMQSGAAVARTMGFGDGDKQWHPTVVNLLVLIILEMVAFSALRYTFNKLK